MSSVLRRKKHKKEKLLINNEEKYGNILKDCFRHIFKSMQLCTWYVLYAPEYFNWEYDNLKNFSDCMDVNNNSHGEDSVNYRDAEKKLSEEIGFDFVTESKKFPYRAKSKMYGKKILPADIPDMVEAMNKATECSYFLVLYTLYHDFDVSVDDIRNKFIPQFEQISYEYSAGLTDDILLKYFRELSGWEIEEEREEVAKIW